ncbi:hypothetical protein DN826_14300 [Stutzerimonas nosocomialis]|uniref:Uncharacterized protein n=1 Tax=Stutzerimonas nosocomialis TaxID=1056496 RepID=A0A5R9QFV7_9GAMM|nr:hypothetical protein [Stutzerimonas nosocomialis]TLX54349.1 hypothetical protein DN826_14300 [Stutzerimonas nosocomialis]TLX64024.1 hypothetical protein DN820_08415 [Stutzerimonas nosocomialis]
MQKKWLDRPATEDTAWIDLAIEGSNGLFRRHLWLVAKVAPPLFGFAIFVLYFYRNRFYPSFDLFQFTSLLLAAAAIGFVVIGVLVVPLFLPGAWIFSQFLDHKAIKDELRYSRPYLDHERGWWVLKLGCLVYWLPYLACTTGLVTVLLLAPKLFALSVMLVPVLTCLLVGLIVQAAFGLPRFSFIRYLWTTDVAVMIVGGFVAVVLIQSAPIIEGFDIGAWKWLVYGLVMIVLSFIAAMCSFIFIAGWNVALHVAAFFALAIAGYSGALTTLPEKTVGALGLGHYRAQTLLLERSYCDAIAAEQLPLDDGCALTDIHVVWSLGEHLVFRTDDERTVQIPSTFVRAIVRSDK